jgi:hypothetical protein
LSLPFFVVCVAVLRRLRRRLCLFQVPFFFGAVTICVVVCRRSLPLWVWLWWSLGSCCGGSASARSRQPVRLPTCGWRHFSAAEFTKAALKCRQTPVPLTARRRQVRARGTRHPEGVTLKRALALVGWCAVAVAVAVAVRRLPLPLPSPLPSALPFAVGGGGCRCRRRWSSALVSLPCGAVVFGVRRCGRVRLSFLPLPCGAVVVIAVHCGLRCGALWACAAVLCDISSRGLNVGKRVGGSPLVILLVICRARWGCAKPFTTFEVNK